MQTQLSSAVFFFFQWKVRHHRKSFTTFFGPCFGALLRFLASDPAEVTDLLLTATPHVRGSDRCSLHGPACGFFAFTYHWHKRRDVVGSRKCFYSGKMALTGRGVRPPSCCYSCLFWAKPILWSLRLHSFHCFLPSDLNCGRYSNTAGWSQIRVQSEFMTGLYPKCSCFITAAFRVEVNGQKSSWESTASELKDPSTSGFCASCKPLLYNFMPYGCTHLGHRDSLKRSPCSSGSVWNNRRKQWVGGGRSECQGDDF